MPGFIKYVIDAVVGAALLVALLVVFVVDRLMSRTGGDTNTLNATVLEDKPGKTKRLKIVVTPTQQDSNPFTKQLELWDDMGQLLRELGDGYQYKEIDPKDFLSDPKKLSEYDVMFLTCKGGGEEYKDMLQNFVANGGILYASDWRYEAIAHAFPEFAEQNLRGKGAPQSLEADVIDESLRDVMGPKIPLNFELGDWKPAAFSGQRVQVLLQGKYKRMPQPLQIGDQFATAPLMIRFPFGKGTVIFTSFHYEKKNSEVEKKLLSYLIFSLVTAGVEAQVNTTMSDAGFKPQRSNLLSTPKDNPSITKEYANSRKGTLRFALGFRNEGAKMKLTIRSPDKKKSFSRECESTIIVDVPDADPGTWTYTVEMIREPYANFPFTVTVAEKK